VDEAGVGAEPAEQVVELLVADRLGYALPPSGGRQRGELAL